VRTFSALDGLRCLSILAVVWHHTAGAAPFGHWFPAAGYGFLGVDLFFEISGFLIVTLILREHDKKGSFSLKHFYARRTLRIFPLYYGILAVLAVLYFVLRRQGANATAFREELPYLLTYLTNWVPASGMLAITWSLSAEEQFYLIWPAIEKWLRRYAVALVGVAIFVSEVIQLGLIDPWLNAWFGWSPDQPAMLREATFVPILLGVLLAHLLHEPKSFHWLARLFGCRWAAAFWLGILVLLCNVLPSDIRGIGRPLVHVVMLLLLTSSVIREDHHLAPPLCWKPVARIGALSYGIYLLHQVAIAVVERACAALGLHDALLLFALGLGGSVLLAALSYRFYESPFLRLKARFS
jgi:peptidoglycan/LPS O-acetylase OafA/YrhL